eukprot:TRINITY_DN8981_c0_g1_i6.p4 TRINITY_DN8981_c0_g1~~TRINITY_DN8981_c0_g1_i6.p4  ORF type:complete len:150 (+),score=23.53 TRINITY_DN8981_c0_g1_i6:995-1444(+)
MAMAGQSQLASLDDEAIFQCNVGGHRRPFMLFRRAITGHEAVCLQAEDELLWTEVDHRNFLDISRTKDDAYITINVNNKLSSEVAILPANDVTQSPIKIAPPSPCSYFVEVCSVRFVDAHQLECCYKQLVHATWAPVLESLKNRDPVFV